MDMGYSEAELQELVQVGGLIRFSVPVEGGFQKNPESREDKLAKLFDPARMEQRFAYFESLCLNALKRQSNPNFRVAIVIGEDMPEPYKRRLEALLEDLPQARLIEKPIMPHRRMVQEAFDEIFDKNTPLRFWFRFDDDDALATDYIEQVWNKIPQLLTIYGGLDPVCLSFSQGLTLIGPADERQLVVAHERSPLGLGLGVLGPAEAHPLVMRYNHMRIHTHLRTLIDPVPVMMLRSIHTSNDSRGILLPHILQERSEDEKREILRQRFGLDMDAVLAL